MPDVVFEVLSFRNGGHAGGNISIQAYLVIWNTRGVLAAIAHSESETLALDEYAESPESPRLRYAMAIPM